MDRQRDKDAAHVHPGVVLARVWGLVRDRHALVSVFHSFRHVAPAGLYILLRGADKWQQYIVLPLVG